MNINKNKFHFTAVLPLFDHPSHPLPLPFLKVNTCIYPGLREGLLYQIFMKLGREGRDGREGMEEGEWSGGKGGKGGKRGKEGKGG